MVGSRKLVGLALFAFVATGCGAEAGGETGEGPSREEMDAELARIRQGLGEATCATTAADTTLPQGGGVESGTPLYDHPTCRNAFVVDAPGIVTGDQQGKLQFVAGVTLGAFEPFTCLFNYGGFTLYQKQNGTYVKVGENFALGTFGLGRGGSGACSALGFVTIPGPGDYKIVAAAGTLFGGKFPVRVTFVTRQ